MIQLLPFALALTVGASIPVPPTIAAGTYTYVASSNGTSVGTTVVTVGASGANTVITEKGTGSAQGRGGTASDTLTLGSDLSPVSYNLVGTLGEQTLKDSATFEKDTATVNGLNGSKSFTLLGSTKHFVVIDIGVISGFIALPAQMAAWENNPVLAVIPSYTASFPVAPDASLKPARPTGAPANDVAIAFGGQIPFTIWYNPASYVTDEIDVPAQGLSVVRK